MKIPRFGETMEQVGFEKLELKAGRRGITSGLVPRQRLWHRFEVVS